MTIRSTNDVRFNFVSETSDGIGFAVRLANEGHDVRAWIRCREAKAVGDNLVEKVGDVEDLIHDAKPDRDVFIFDVTSNGIIADSLRDKGFGVLGDSVLADRLERDRTFGYNVMQKCDIEVPETKSFSDFTTAIDFVRDNPETRWVYKPSKQLGDLSVSHVSYDSEDLIEMLSNIEHEVDIADPQFELQAFEKGVAISSELWFQNGEFIEPMTNHTLERKELMNDDLGSSGGCTGNIVWVCEGCPICDVAKQLVPWCERNRYHGMIDLNAIITPKQVYGLEFTPRFGYDASPTFLWELVNNDMGQFFADIARGTLQDIDMQTGVYAGALRVTISPWPMEKYCADENVPLRGLDKKYDKDTFLYNVKKDPESGNLVSAGAWGILLLLTHQASSINGCLRKPLERAKELKIKGKQFRTDLPERFKEDLEKLEAAVGGKVLI